MNIADSSQQRNNNGQSGLVDLVALAGAITAHLEADGARRNGGELTFRCPAPEHEDRNPSAGWNLADGVWCCYARHCEATHGAGALHLAALLGIDVDPFREPAPRPPAPRRAPPERHNGTGPTKAPDKGQGARAAAGAAPAAPYANLADFEARRCLPAGYLATVWKVTEGKHKGRPAMFWPSAPGMPARLKYLDGQAPKYGWAAAGGGAHWYGLALALKRLAADPSAPLYIVNGEPSVWAAAANKVAAVCLAVGEGAAGAAAKLAPDLLEALASVRRPVAVRVVFDADGAGRAGGSKVAAALTAAGLDAAALDLATWKGWSKAGPPAGADVGDAYQEAGAAGLAVALASLPPMQDSQAPEPEPPASSTKADGGGEGATRWQGIPYCPPRKWECDDYGNGGRLVTLYGDRMRWHAARKAWLTYDGRRWADDNRGAVAHLVRLTVRSILHEAADESDKDREAALLKWHKASANGGRPGEMLNRARIDLTTPGEEWDADPWALNVANGTLNLLTGELRPHDPADFLTLLAPVEYHDGAHLAGSGPLAAGAALWLRFLSDATGGDDDLAAYLQRAAGATLAGDTRGTDALFFIFGPGGTGKSSFANALFRILGDYADTVDAGALMKAREATGPRPEIAKLQGKRMAVAFEAEAGRAFNDALVKTLTGGDKISARMLHANPVTFEPQFTFWLVANDKPRADVNDSGFWRRVKTLPFTAKPPGPPDVTLRDRLPLEAGPAILAWAFEGCQAWQADGLGPAPKAVEAATAEYRASVDPLADWLADRCIFEPKAWAAAGRLYDDYTWWARGAGEPDPLSSKVFGKHVKAIVGESTPRTVAGASVRGYRGIGLKVAPPNDGGGRDYGVTEVTEENSNSLKNGHRLSELHETTVTSVVGRDAEPAPVLAAPLPAELLPL